VSRTIGLDVEEIERFRKRSKVLTRLLDTVFSATERSYFFSNGEKMETLAGIFAAKEALVKALSQLTNQEFSVYDFEILHKKSGTPFPSPRNKRAKKILDGTNVSVSISHTKEFAFSVAIAESISRSKGKRA
jgi:holo-[acyl-carrier protein] synthase